jgi:hypothetical protein
MCFDQRFVWERRPKLVEFSAPIIVHSTFNSIFGKFTLKIGMSANYEKCVPGNNEQLSYWPILNFYSEIWTTRKKTESGFFEI